MRLKWNNVLNSLLKTAVYVMDQAAEKVDRASDRAYEMADDARTAIFPEDHTLRHVLLFAAGVGVGVGAGLLLAPAVARKPATRLLRRCRTSATK
jgi:hypothetical protein